MRCSQEGQFWIILEDLDRKRTRKASRGGTKTRQANLKSQILIFLGSVRFPLCSDLPFPFFFRRKLRLFVRAICFIRALGQHNAALLALRSREQLEPRLCEQQNSSFCSRDPSIPSLGGKRSSARQAAVVSFTDCDSETSSVCTGNFHGRVSNF